MITRILTDKDKEKYDSLIVHPVQTWDWGDFQITQGHTVYRFGVFDDNDKMISAYSVSFHKIPKTKFSIGTSLRGPNIDDFMIEKITEIAKKENAIFVKFEPNIIHKNIDSFGNETNLNPKPQFNHLKKSPKVAFYPFTYLVDLNKTEDQLLESMHPKTRYNIRVANRYGVEVKEQTDDKGFEIYLELLFDTTKRQGFYLHSEKYHRDLWKKLKDTGMIHIMLSSYQNQVLSAFMIFNIKDKLFYPYGASLDINRQVMAPTLLMWEVIKLGQKLKCTTFDMWGCLGPHAKEGENGYGFHRFKQGYGGQLVEYVGTYDLVINPLLYQAYNSVDKIRWKILRLKASILRK
ncbi:MAG: peptidoglycan bridge formation glycyltransferase FemA/FemB family protein [Candidatus Shapirobacteria bacterium]|nr:peptidoglycan bridge formation glycyltransferase FemA/FemB family protein [Candidatus Shapirobacteria bacterium]MDD4410777.1 peptidoglycan bridge formation glycyltransferase FemA/FemB family protein [Candidatus Shapirobacteria bacterium]